MSSIGWGEDIDSLVPTHAHRSEFLFVQATKFIRKLRGASQSFLVEADDKHYYIVKAAGNPQGSNRLFNEFVGTVLARASGLPVPSNVFISLPKTLIDKNVELVFQGPGKGYPIQPGIHYGSRLIGNALGLDRGIEYLNRTDALHVANKSEFLGMFLFDVLTNNQNGRQAIFTRSHDSRALQAVFINFGHLCGGPEWKLPPRHSLAYHFQTSIYSNLWSNRAVSSWIEKFLDTIPQALSMAIPLIPRHWFLGDARLAEATLLDRLTNHRRWIQTRCIPSGPFRQGLSSYEVLRVHNRRVRAV